MGTDYLQQKKLLLESMLDNTQAQTKALEKEAMDDLEDLIGERQEIMGQIDALDGESKAMISELTSEEKESIKNLLKRIMKADHANESFMKEELGNAQKELRKIRRGRQQEENYGTEYGSYKEEGVFFDTKE